VADLEILEYIMSTKRRLTLVGVAAASGFGSGLLLSKNMSLIVDHPKGYFDLLIIVLFAAGLVVSSSTTLLLTAEQSFPNLQGPAWIIVWALRSVAVLVGSVGVILGMSSIPLLLSRSVSRAGFSREVWHAVVVLSTSAFIIFLIMQYKRRTSRQ
jgi:predicted membrane channel-forming protein YqfA (hemolysin III family)